MAEVVTRLGKNGFTIFSKSFKLGNLGVTQIYLVLNLTLIISVITKIKHLTLLPKSIWLEMTIKFESNEFYTMSELICILSNRLNMNGFWDFLKYN